MELQDQGTSGTDCSLFPGLPTPMPDLGQQARGILSQSRVVPVGSENPDSDPRICKAGT